MRRPRSLPGSGRDQGARPDSVVLARPQDLHPQEAPSALRRGGVSGSAGQAVPRAADAGRAAAAPEPQRGAARAPPGVHARQRRPAPPRRAAPAQGRLFAGRPRGPRGRAQVPGTGCGRLSVGGLRNGDPAEGAGEKRGHLGVGVQERLRGVGRGPLPSHAPRGLLSQEKGTLSDPTPPLLSPQDSPSLQGQQELWLHAAWPWTCLDRVCPAW